MKCRLLGNVSQHQGLFGSGTVSLPSGSPYGWGANSAAEHLGCETPLRVTGIHWFSLHLALAVGLSTGCSDVAGGDKAQGGVRERSTKTGVMTPQMLGFGWHCKSYSS